MNSVTFFVGWEEFQTSVVILRSAATKNLCVMYRMGNYYVYILKNKSKTLYVGMTNNLERRMYEHKNKLVPGFTSKYNLNILLYYEQTASVLSAIEREKQLKGWLRKKKIELIESENPEWSDLSSELF